LIAPGIATLILLLAMAPCRWADAGHGRAGIITFELTGGEHRALARNRDWRRLGAIGATVVSFGALGAAFDALENVCLLLTLDGAGTALPLLATIFATCKLILLGVAIAYLLAGLAMRLRARGAAASGRSRA
jgi:hypothetical protein